MFISTNPDTDESWKENSLKIFVDGIHQRGFFFIIIKINNNLKIDSDTHTKNTPNYYSQAIKMLKPLQLLKIINSFKMDQAMIFCR